MVLSNYDLFEPLRVLQNLFEAVFGIEIDNRNFRKKLFASGILVETDEIEKHVNHKPAKLYMLNKASFGKKENGYSKSATLFYFGKLFGINK